MLKKTTTKKLKNIIPEKDLSELKKKMSKNIFEIKINKKFDYTDNHLVDFEVSILRCKRVGYFSK